MSEELKMREIVARVTQGGEFRWHDDKRDGIYSYRYCLTGKSGSLFLSCERVCHDVMNPYDDSADFKDRPVTVEDAGALLLYARFRED